MEAGAWTFKVTELLGKKETQFREAPVRHPPQRKESVRLGFLGLKQSHFILEPKRR